MTVPIDLLTAARAEALFTSDFSTGAQPACAEVTAAIRRAVRVHGGTWACVTALAGQYGDHPETARAPDALGVVRAAYARHPEAALPQRLAS